MKSVILAANRSPRLIPFVETRSAPMIRIAGQYILEKMILDLKEAGINEIIIVVDGELDIIKQHFRAGQDFGVSIDYIIQKKRQGIGQALSLCKPILDKNPFLLVYGDALTDRNPILPILQTYSEINREVALVALPESSKDFGNVYIDHEMRILKFVEKPEGNQSNYVFAGLFVLFNDIFDLLEKNENDISKCYAQMIEKRRINACIWENEWIDMINPWHVLDANRMLMNSWKNSEIDSTTKLMGHVHIDGAVHIGSNVTVESGTILKGPCYIGPNSYIGNNSLIRKYSAIGPSSIIGYGSELKNCVLFGNNDVGRLSFVGDSVIGENVISGSGLTTVNHTVDYTPIRCTINSESIQTGLEKLGSFIGDNVFIGARHTLGPGTIINSGKTMKDCITI